MFYSIRSKLIASLLGVALFVGAVSLFTSVRMFNKHVIGEAANRVRLDLNAASEMYRSQTQYVRISLSVTTLGMGFINALTSQNIQDLIFRLNRMAHFAKLDFAGIVTGKGEVLCRMGTMALEDNRASSANPICRLALQRRAAVDGTVVFTREMLIAEDPELVEKARIRQLNNRGLPVDGDDQTDGMAIAAAIPIFENQALIGVLYGGRLLNRNEAFVDSIRDTVFQGEIYKERNVGTATLFLGDTRVATNVLTPNGKRAIGTRVSPEVERVVVEKGQIWTGRAFVVSNWYISAYEPIEHIFGRPVGMLYVGVLEEKYSDIRMQAFTIFILITAAGMIVAVGFGFVLANPIIGPINRLIKASRQVSEGSLAPEIGPIEKGELGVLQKTFAEMVTAVGRRRAANESQIIQSEKQASVGRLAAGVAHEINNPLTGVLTYTHMLLRRKDIDAEIRSDLETIASATERVRKIVKGLLDFSRQTKLDPEPTEVNRLVSGTVELLENQALVKGVSIKFEPGESLPMVTLDRSQIQSVLMNLIINALDATEPGASIRIYTATALSGNGSVHKGVEITVADTGSGIHPDHLDKLFDPFFTTKVVGQGTGLGLSVSQGIVHHHDGHIRVQSELGKGTRFFVWLPLEKAGEKS